MQYKLMFWLYQPKIAIQALYVGQCTNLSVSISAGWDMNNKVNFLKLNWVYDMYLLDSAWVWRTDYSWSSIKTAETNILFWHLFEKVSTSKDTFYWLSRLYLVFFALLVWFLYISGSYTFQVQLTSHRKIVFIEFCRNCQVWLQIIDVMWCRMESDVVLCISWIELVINSLNTPFFFIFAYFHAFPKFSNHVQKQIC